MKPPILPAGPGPKFLVALSGGVDSTVTLALLKYAGLPVVGVHLRFWAEKPCAAGVCGTGEKPAGAEFDAENATNKCCDADSLFAARRACARLRVPFYTLDTRDLFRSKVVENFLAGIEAGEMPNPCVRCNEFVKLGGLAEFAAKMGPDFLVATGHYARLVAPGSPPRDFPAKIADSLARDRQTGNSFRPHPGIRAGLAKYFDQTLPPPAGALFARAADPTKDQSYFLARVSAKKREKLVFPLGGLDKKTVQKIAAAWDLAPPKKESMGLCFFAEKTPENFIRRQLGPGPAGAILDSENREIGRHDGLFLTTLGERARIGGRPEPDFVVGRDLATGAVRTDSEKNLGRREVFVRDLRWDAPEKFQKNLRGQARFRAETAGVEKIEKIGENLWRVGLAESLRLPVPGQFWVFWAGEMVAGTGWVAGPPAPRR